MPIISVPFGADFITTVATHIAAEHPSPIALANTTIWVPTTRLVSALQNALHQAAGNTLLPTIKPLQLTEEETAATFLTQGLSGLPLVSPAARVLFFARQIRSKDPNLAPEHILGAAHSLANLVDTLTRHQVPFSELRHAAPAELAHHWQENLAFLEIALTAYPAWLDETQQQDSAAASVAWLTNLAKTIRTDGLDNPTYAVGFADSTPAGIDFLSALTAAGGTLVLPGWNPDHATEELTISHPNAGMQQMLQQMNAQDEPCSLWGTPIPSIRNSLTFANTEQEASAIAMLVREALDTPNTTCAVVTPDRILAQQIKVHASHWGITLDDSGGQPLSQTPAGRLVASFITVAAEKAMPLALAALLKQPGIAIDTTTSLAFERAALRGPKSLHWQAYGSRVQQADDSVIALWEKLEVAIQTLLNVDKKDLSSKITALHSVLEALAPEWQNLTGGAEMAAQLTEWHTHAALIGTWAPWNLLAALFAHQGALVSVRPPHTQTARAFLWGPLEARGQQVDCLIIAGCNEGTWPHTLQPHPWLNRAMFNRLNLPAPDKVWALAAHDFWQLAHQHHVTFTRSEYDTEGETTPSRFLLRIQAENSESWHQRQAEIDFWLASHREHSTLTAALPSNPNPPTKTRPTAWSASTVKALMQCPYQLYVHKILHARPLAKLEEPVDAALRGQLIHRWLEAFFNPVPGIPAPFGAPVTAANQEEALAHLLTQSTAVLTHIPASLQAVWQPRLTRIAEAFIEKLVAHPERQIIGCEITASAPCQTITLSATADRIDHSDTGATLVDYKTGRAPGKAELEDGTEPQMWVEGWLQQQVGFGVTTPLNGLEHWQLSGGTPAVKIEPVALPEDWFGTVDTALHTLVDHYTAPATTYPAIATSKACQYCDHAGICRKHDWEGRVGHVS